MNRHFRRLFARLGSSRKERKERKLRQAIAGKRIIARSKSDRIIQEKKPCHSMTYGAAGSGKTSAVSVTSHLSMLADKSRCQVVVDKEGEIAAQCAEVAAKLGRRVAIIDPAHVLGEDNRFRIDLNPFAGVCAAYRSNNGDLLFSTENATYALIPEPADDAKNAVFRSWPRYLIEFCKRYELDRFGRTTPGGVWGILADTDTLLSVAKNCSEDEDYVLSSMARNILADSETDRNFPQHVSEAVKSLRIFSHGSFLHLVGTESDITPEEMIRQGYVVYIVAPQRHMERLGAFYALHIQSFMEALLMGGVGRVTWICDEFTNIPLRPLVEKLTVIRAYGGDVHMLVQSHSELVRKLGAELTKTIEENAIVKLWLGGFSSFEQAERIAKNVGETRTTSRSLSFNSDKRDYSVSYQNGKEAHFPANELMSMGPNDVVGHIKDVGWFRGKPLRQNQLAPFCHQLADNPVEGGRLPPDPVVWVPTEMGEGVMKPRLIRLSFFVWLVIPAALYLTYLVAGTPYFIVSYSWRNNGTMNPWANRYYTRCTFYSVAGKSRTTHPSNGQCEWVRFFEQNGDG